MVARRAANGTKADQRGKDTRNLLRQATKLPDRMGPEECLVHEACRYQMHSKAVASWKRWR